VRNLGALADLLAAATWPERDYDKAPG